VNGRAPAKKRSGMAGVIVTHITFIAQENCGFPVPENSFNSH